VIEAIGTSFGNSGTAVVALAGGVLGTVGAGVGSRVVVVEVAPGVFASRGQGSLGMVDDYKGVFGLCSDVHPFEMAHQAGGTCW
jgi:hypothetical protein